MNGYLGKRMLRIVCVLVLAAAMVPLAALPALAGTATAPVFRFYHAGPGTHFYTASEQERDAVMANWPTEFAYEGIAYYAPLSESVETDASVTSLYAVPLYRFYNKSNGSHFYTISESEKALVQSKYPGVYAFEGPAYEVFSENPVGDPGIRPVYRFYNRVNGSHFYTITENEKAFVQLAWSDIYSYEGIAFWAYDWNFRF